MANNKKTLLELQKIIIGQRDVNTPLTANEINKFLLEDITPEFIYLLLLSLQRNIINVDLLLTQLIYNLNKGGKKYLIPIALALRYGGNPNMYVNIPSIGIAHFLGYVYLHANNVDIYVINTIVLMAIIKGSRAVMPMFDKEAGKITADIPGKVSKGISVKDWLTDHEYPTILQQTTILNIPKIVEPETLHYISILLDDPKYFTRKLIEGDITSIIQAHSNNLLTLTPLPKAKKLMDHVVLLDSLKYLNHGAFNHYMLKGVCPSYMLVNEILIKMKSYLQRDEKLIMLLLEKILSEIVKQGIELDQDQLSILSTLGKDIFDNIYKEYGQPYWRKICKSKTCMESIPKTLQKLALALDIDPTMDKNAICRHIDILSKADPEAVKEAAIRKQQNRVAAKTSGVQDFISEKTPAIVCRNASVLRNNPFDYNNYTLATYKDEQGALWCFPSDMYESLIEDGINPYNMEKIPDSVKIEMEGKLHILRKVGADIKDPQSFSDAINELSTPDVINQKNSEEELRKFITLVGKHGVSPETINSLTKLQMMDALRSIGYRVDLQPLSTSHALVTFSRIGNYIDKNMASDFPIMLTAIIAK